MNNIIVSASTLALICLSTVNAFAALHEEVQEPVPIPIAGAAGPIGLGVVVVGYIGYRVWTRNR